VEYEKDGVRPRRSRWDEAVPDIAGPHHDEGLGEKAVHIHRVQGGQRTVRAYAHHRSPTQQLGRLEAGWYVVAVKVVHQPEVEGALQQTAVDVGLLGADHLDLGGRVRGAELTHGRDEQRDGGRVDRAEPHHPADAVLVAGRAAQPVHRVQHGHDVRQQLPALVADLRPRPFALQQVHTELPLQIAHGLAERGLGQMQFLGGTPQRTEPGDGGDVFQLFYSHDRRLRPPRVRFKGIPVTTS
jgi:hypothetical protein